MDLSDFPRPPADNGRGIHWSPGIANQVGDNVIRDHWLPELEALGVKWLKFISTGGGGLAELLLARGIMPVVRLGGRKSFPGPLDDPRHGGAYVTELQKYVAQGVRYFEVCNEPNLPTEWVSGVLPPDDELVGTVMAAWVRSAEVVMGAGGLPAFPALAPGGVFDDVRFFRQACQWLVDHGHINLMRQGVWIAIHNYSLHRPWDYPEDDVNQWGTPVTSQEYGQHRWWNNQRWDQVNELRATHTNLGHTIMDDSNGFQKFEQFQRIWADHLGFTVPILSTESGYTITQPGEGFGDHRYPQIDFALHARYTVRQYEYLMREAPAYYFCTADWIIANALLGNPDAQWESQAWYTNYYAGQGVKHHLPTVDAVKAMPNEPRLPASGPAEVSVIQGAVANAAGICVTLCGDQTTQEQHANEGGRFEFRRLPASTYELDVDRLGTVAQDLATDGRNRILVPTIQGIDLPAWVALLVSSTSGPVVVGGMSSSIVVRVLKLDRVDVALSLGTWHITVTTGPKLPLGLNVCEFAPLRGGTYHIAIPELGIATDVFVDGQGSADLEIRSAGAAAPVVWQRGRVRGRILGALGRVLALVGDDLRRESTLLADGTYDFGDLPAGLYRLELDGQVVARDLETDGLAAIDVPSITVSTDTWTAEVVHSTSGSQPTGGRSSAILCEVEGRDQLDVVISVGTWQATARTGQKGPDKCEFGALGAGWYTLTPTNLGVALNVWV
ncbi:MAG: hypothetical protein KJ734_02195, partial [Chloroflexi bacterium]|nr:hypothetical protein [Chloroflexota bacterium]